MRLERLTKVKRFLSNAEIENVGSEAGGKEYLRFMNGPKRMLNILVNKEGE